MPTPTEQQLVAEKRAADAAHGTLMERVALPALWEKVAAAGVPIPTAEAAHEMAKLAQVVCPAVGRAIDRITAVVPGAEGAVIKGAADTAMALAGYGAPAQHLERPGTPAVNFLADADVGAAAHALVVEQLRKAGMDVEAMFGATEPRKTEAGEDPDEDEKAKKKTMPNAGAGAPCP